jgi:hypothetical protein
MDELKKRPGRPKGTGKTGGRSKGTPNNSTKTFADVLGANAFSIPEQAVQLFNSTADQNLKFKILQFLAEYSHSKVKEQEPQVPEEPQDNPLTDAATADLLKFVKGGTV